MHSYKANYKLVLINYAEKTNNCSAVRKFRSLNWTSKVGSNKMRSW